MDTETAPQLSHDPDAFARANRLFFRLYQCANLLHKHGTKAVEAHGATTQQWAVLGALARPDRLEHGMNVKDLAGFLEVSRQNLSVVLDRMERRGLVERIRGIDDGRSRFIRLTAAGRQLWLDLSAPIEAFYTGALRHLPETEQVTFIEGLDRLRAGLSET